MTARRIAFLILCHAQPEHLARLVDRLVDPRTHCFVHIDRKVDSRPFLDLFNDASQVTFVPDGDRRSILWCGFSMVSATLALIRFARNHGNFERFVLLSGSDYPVKPLDHILEVIGSDEELIQIDMEVTEKGSSKFDTCANRYFLGDIKVLNPRSGLRPLKRISRRLETMVPRSFPPGVRIFYGPQWWALTNEAIVQILDVATARPELLRWFRYARTPDEMFFQTALRLTKRANRIAFDYTRLQEMVREPNRFALHYINWTEPNPHAPRVMTTDDLGGITTSAALFARKFDPIRSAAALEAIDGALRERP